MNKTALKPSTTPDEVRRVFGDNLKVLAASSPSIAQLCRDLGMNRSQFNRYLHGEAFPRPDVLAKICDYFGRDARILLQPIAEIDADKLEQALSEFDATPFLNKMAKFDHQKLPDGLYRFLAPAFTRPEEIAQYVLQFKTTPSGAKLVTWPVPKTYTDLTGQSGAWRDRRQDGVCYQHADGVSVQVTTAYSSYILGAFFSYGYQGMSDIHTGYATITQARGPGLSQVQPAILHRIHSCGAAVEAHKQPAIARVDDLQPRYRNYILNWTPQ